MAKKETKSSDVARLAFLACLLIGFGIGMAFDQAAVGIMVGLGVGYGAMALLRARAK